MDLRASRIQAHRTTADHSRHTRRSRGSRSSSQREALPALAMGRRSSRGIDPHSLSLHHEELQQQDERLREWELSTQQWVAGLSPRGEGRSTSRSRRSLDNQRQELQQQPQQQPGSVAAAAAQSAAPGGAGPDVRYEYQDTQHYSEYHMPYAAPAAMHGGSIDEQPHAAQLPADESLDDRSDSSSSSSSSSLLDDSLPQAASVPTSPSPRSVSAADDTSALPSPVSTRHTNTSYEPPATATGSEPEPAGHRPSTDQGHHSIMSAHIMSAHVPEPQPQPQLPPPAQAERSPELRQVASVLLYESSTPGWGSAGPPATAPATETAQAAAPCMPQLTESPHGSFSSDAAAAAAAAAAAEAELSAAGAVAAIALASSTRRHDDSSSSGAARSPPARHQHSRSRGSSAAASPLAHHQQHNTAAGSAPPLVSQRPQDPRLQQAWAEAEAQGLLQPADSSVQPMRASSRAGRLSSTGPRHKPHRESRRSRAASHSPDGRRRLPHLAPTQEDLSAGIPPAFEGEGMHPEHQPHHYRSRRRTQQHAAMQEHSGEAAGARHQHSPGKPEELPLGCSDAAEQRPGSLGSGRSRHSLDLQDHHAQGGGGSAEPHRRRSTERRSNSLEMRRQAVLPAAELEQQQCRRRSLESSGGGSSSHRQHELLSGTPSPAGPECSTSPGMSDSRDQQRGSRSRSGSQRLLASSGGSSRGGTPGAAPGDKPQQVADMEQGAHTSSRRDQPQRHSSFPSARSRQHDTVLIWSDEDAAVPGPARVRSHSPGSRRSRSSGQQQQLGKHDVGASRHRLASSSTRWLDGAGHRRTASGTPTHQQREADVVGSDLTDLANCCAICMDHAVAIQLTSCAHTLCMQCAFHLCSKGNATPLCPFCRTPIAGFDPTAIAQQA
jgi:hypothetical protein